MKQRLLVPKLSTIADLSTSGSPAASVLSARGAHLLPREARTPTSGPRHERLLAQDEADAEAQAANNAADAVNRASLLPRDYSANCPQRRLVELGIHARGVEDMIAIDTLTEESILLNLQRRYEDDHIYVRIVSACVRVCNVCVR
jgi:hypothetical protein